MKNSKIYSFALFLVALGAGCAKDDTAPANTFVAGPAVKTQLTFSVGERSYAVDALMDRAESSDPGTCAGASSEYAPGCVDVQTQWTRYFSSSRSISITRQDAAAAPAYRLNLFIPSYDLDYPTTPLDVSDARLTLYDLQHVFVPLGDDPAAGPVELSATGEALSLTITAVQADVVEGTFSGTLTAANNAQVKIENGTFKARLWRL